MGNGSKFSPEVRERAVRLVFEQVKDNEPKWPVIVSVATKIGYTAETLKRGYGRLNGIRVSAGPAPY